MIVFPARKPLILGALSLFVSLAFACGNEPGDAASDAGTESDEGNESSFGPNAPGDSVNERLITTRPPAGQVQLCLDKSSIEFGTASNPALCRQAGEQVWDVHRRNRSKPNTVNICTLGVCLDMATCGVAVRSSDGDAVSVCPDSFDRHDTQRWVISDAGNGLVYLKNERTGKCLTTTYGNAPYPAGVQFAQYPCDKRSGQAWYRHAHWVGDLMKSSASQAAGGYVTVGQGLIASAELIALDNAACGTPGKPICSDVPPAKMRATAVPSLGGTSGAHTCEGGSGERGNGERWCNVYLGLRGVAFDITVEGWDHFGNPSRTERFKGFVIR